MKLIFPFLATLILLSAALSAGEARFLLGVNGMSCPFCVYGIEKRLKKIDGVEDVRADLAQGKIWVEATGADVLSEDGARLALEQAGFTLRSFEVHNPVQHELEKKKSGQDE